MNDSYGVFLEGKQDPGLVHKDLHLDDWTVKSCICKPCARTTRLCQCDWCQSCHPCACKHSNHIVVTDVILAIPLDSHTSIKLWPHMTFLPSLWMQNHTSSNNRNHFGKPSIRIFWGYRCESSHVQTNHVKDLGFDPAKSAPKSYRGNVCNIACA